MTIKLPDFVIADLYKNSLVIVGSPVATAKTVKTVVETPITSEGKEEEKFYFGGNKKNILFLIKTISAIYINDDTLATLTKILEALKMNLADIAIINYYPHPKTFQELKETLQPKYIFLFDINLKQLQLPFTIPHYQIQKYDNCTFMTAPEITLSSINSPAVKKEKKQLWESLKTIFKA